MLNRLKQYKKQDGFTIIEVLIVLAIAGLIMVVVFLAVPNLQRSQKNNAISSDANSVFTAIGNLVADDNGVTTGLKLAGGNGTPIVVSYASGSSNTENVTVGGNIVAPTTTVPTATTAPGTFYVTSGSGAVCNATKSGLTTGGTTRSYALLYTTDNGGGKSIVKCLDNN